MTELLVFFILEKLCCYEGVMSGTTVCCYISDYALCFKGACGF